MAISDTITSMYENVGNVYDILELAGADLTNVDKNIFNLKQSWEERLLYFLANGTDVVWNNWLPKVTGTGETITLNNTIEAKMDFVYKGNTSQEGTPTPEAPQDIHVVSGDNTIIVSNSDNTQSQSYHVSLGNIELCKIGTYQDKIYKDNGKWYLNKQIGKVVLNGSEDGWNSGNVGTDARRFYKSFSINGIIAYTDTIRHGDRILCDYFNTSNVFDNIIGTMYQYQTQVFFNMKRADYPNTGAWTTWLSSNNITLYFVLATPTYTEITDTTLISQLEALKKSYNNQTNISQENSKEAFILDVTALGN